MPSPTAVSLRLDAERSHLLESLLADLEPDALHWLAGYVAGLARSATGAAVRHPGATATSPAAAAAVARRATVLYGSQTGNSRRIAERLAEQLNQPVRSPFWGRLRDFCRVLHPNRIDADQEKSQGKG